ncbi:hypothetical protein [Deinococcus hopiensis]|uniref:DUF1795 domain-containing protein n=1 Tax=Deinococcus hopiensis KR-140 TaxID=695939 RepID=A0A1W1VEK1_9DEIO|nr:hypothetical protein [Deinococcus hopiensis]SMB91746.1 hypothetical protein SAMN00790413_01277 [Deinococcus hopiensis KR-140]
MKRFLSVSLVALTFGTAALFGTAGAQTLVPLKDARLPFRVSVPQGWLGVNFKDGTSGVSMVSAKTPPAALIRLLFMPKNGKPGDPAQEFAGFEAGVKQTGGKLSMLGTKSVSYGGVRGIERQYTLTHSKGKLRLRVWFGNGAKNLYSFQITDTPERFTASNAVFTRVLGSVRF